MIETIKEQLEENEKLLIHYLLISMFQEKKHIINLTEQYQLYHQQLARFNDLTRISKIKISLTKIVRI